MSVSYRVGLGGASTVDLGNVMYLGDIPGFTERADGTIGMSGCTLQDPGGDLDFYGLNKWEVEESDATNVRIFSGITIDRRIRRGPFDRTDVHAIWELDVADQNEFLHLRVLRDGNHGNRPAETDVARIAWLLDEPLANGHVINGTGGYFGANGPTAGVLGAPRNLDAADYRGQHAIDVLNDIGPPGNRRFFTYYDPDLDAICLFYGLNTEHLGDSDVRISNVLSDEDADTFYPMLDAELDINPEAVWGGLYYTYKSGQKHIYREDPATIATFLDRSGAITNDKVGSDATASTFVDRLLDKMGTERYSITATIRLPKERVNDVVAGQRMAVKFSHLPGFEGFTFMHVIARTVAQDFPNKDFYTVKLELSDYVGGLGTGGSGGGGPFVPGDEGGGSCAGGAYPLTPSQHFYPLGSGTSDADGYVVYAAFAGPFTSPQPFYAGGLGFAVYNGPGGPDFTGDCLGVGYHFIMVGAGTLTIQTAASTSVKSLKATVYHWTAGVSSADYVTTGITIGDDVVMVIPADDSDDCVHNITLTDDAGTCGGGYGYAGADWVAGATVANTPTHGQLVTEAVTGDGSTTALGTNYGYLPNSLGVTVGGVTVVPTQTDPAAGTFTLPFAPATGTQVLITYQAADGTDTGAGNDPDPPSVTPTVPDDALPPPSGATELDDLSDVTITAPAADDTLRYVGGVWVNDDRRYEVVTDGEDVFVWDGDDLLHEWSG